MKKAPAMVLIVLVALLGRALPAGAEKALLTDAQLDAVSAGKWDSIDFSGPGQGAKSGHVYAVYRFGSGLFGGEAPVPKVPTVGSVPLVSNVPLVPNVRLGGSGQFLGGGIK